ncbi:MAG TPA: tetratricopeptide repeat protein [Terriglobales bacterium]|jgi:tetratricopeptide (TPR) repeat protein|nr:tetratricopeptide repeat protein [Terriglobales bacterium]
MPELADDLLLQALQARREHRLADAERVLIKAVALYRESGNRAELARALATLGQIERDQRHLDDALRHYQEALALYRAEDDPQPIAHTVRHVADILREAGRHKMAEPYYLESLKLYRSEAGTDTLDLANAIRGLALLKSDIGEAEPARSLWEEARELYAAVRVDAGVAECDRRLGLLQRGA